MWFNNVIMSFSPCWKLFTKKNLKVEELYDNEILEMAMENTYNLIMGNTTLKELLDEGWDVMPLLCDVANPTENDIQNLLQYYEEEEDYEKCTKILDYLKKQK